MGPNFAECAKRFLANSTLSQQYGWKGRVWYVASNSSTQISYEGCLAVCGKGADYYPWSQIASTITTWILPIVGIMLQAPFESNRPWATLWALARWIGSPIASMSYIIWNIKVSAKCALMVDMSSSIDEPNSDSDSSDMRDSLYILSAMNQYSMKPIVITKLKREAEGLLRIALFSKDLHLRTPEKRLKQLRREIIGTTELRLRTSDKTLGELRREVAHELREHRKRGVVPVFISIMWFIFSLIISIQSSFGFLGDNTTAHDLATGLLMSWLPVLILASIVDRNFNSPEVVREKLNLLVNRVCDSLAHLADPPDVAQTNEGIRRHYIYTFKDAPQEKRERMTAWVTEISEKCGHMKDFFVRFAGQGRERWHYGAAHPILTSIEKNYIAQHRRPWLANEQEARLELVLSDPSESLIWFDWREIWEVLASCAILFCSVTGAFLLSFSTPTVGLGCRSGYFMIFFLNSFSLAVLEFFMWATSLPTRLHSAFGTRLRRQSTVLVSLWADVLQQAQYKLQTSISYLLGMCRLSVSHRSSVERSISSFFDNVGNWGGRQWADFCFFRPLELANLFWLAYVVMGQAIGSYQTCYCQASSWNIIGGYIDFTQYALSDIPLLYVAWPIATAISTSSMGIAMVLVVREWCLQSHLSTQNPQKARSGLRRTRQYRWLEHYSPFYFVYQLCSNAPITLLRLTTWLLSCLHIPSFLWKPENLGRTSLVWQWHDDPVDDSTLHVSARILDNHEGPSRPSHDRDSINDFHNVEMQAMRAFEFPNSASIVGLSAPNLLRPHAITRRSVSIASRSSNNIPLIQVTTPLPNQTSGSSDGSQSNLEEVQMSNDDGSSLTSWDLGHNHTSD